MKRTSMLAGALMACVCTTIQSLAQLPDPPPELEGQLRPGPELDVMLWPLALYPDPLLAQILPATTLPGEIVLADRYLNSGGDPELIDEQPWHSCVKAVARYPVILQWLDDYLGWATAVGEAFLYQPEDVMDSIQRLRAKALALGNLQNTPQQTVYLEDGLVEIAPANPEEVCLPAYQPEIYTVPSYGHPCISFVARAPAGQWLNHDFDWRNHQVVVWHHDYPRPADWWSHRPSERPEVGDAHRTVWQPHSRGGTHPGELADATGGGSSAHRGGSTVTIVGGRSGATGGRGGGVGLGGRGTIGGQGSHGGWQPGSGGQGGHQAATSHSSSGSSSVGGSHSASSSTGASHSGSSASGASHSGSSGSSGGGGRH